MSVQGENHSCLVQIWLPMLVRVQTSRGPAVLDLASRAYSQQTTPFTKPTLEWVTVTHPHHPLHGQRVQVIRVRRGTEPDLIIRMPDGYHGAIAASLTDYDGPVDPNLSTAEPPLLSIEGLWQIAQWARQQQESQSQRGAHEI
jgi:hypothetical protein